MLKLRQVFNRINLVVCFCIFSSAFVLLLNNVSACKDEVNENDSFSSISNCSGKNDIGPILHVWCWNFEKVISQINTISNAGYRSIQVSPVQKAKTTTEEYSQNKKALSSWWSLYQPLNFKIGNCLGSKDDFEKMCKCAHQSGLKIIVDVVVNHLANDGDANNIRPSSQIDQDLLCIEGGLFHNTGCERFNPENASRFEITQKSFGMPSVNTRNPKVQEVIINFLEELIASGADGFRFDAAKHIELPDDDDSFKSDFWPNVIEKVKRKKNDIYIYGEILSDNKNSNNKFDSYLKYMNITDSKFGDLIVDAICNKDTTKLRDLNTLYSATTDSEKFGRLLAWIESHDTFTQLNPNSTMKIDDLTIILGWAILACRRNSVPLFFVRPHCSQLMLNENQETLTGKMGGPSNEVWFDNTVVKINNFRRIAADLPEYIKVFDGIYIVERGNLGAVIVNLSDSDKQISYSSNLENGSYMNVVSGNSDSIKVENKILTCKLSGKSIAIIYNTSFSIPDINLQLMPLSGKVNNTINPRLSIENADNAICFWYCCSENFTNALTLQRVGEIQKKLESLCNQDENQNLSEVSRSLSSEFKDPFNIEKCKNSSYITIDKENTSITDQEGQNRENVPSQSDSNDIKIPIKFKNNNDKIIVTLIAKSNKNVVSDYCPLIIKRYQIKKENINRFISEIRISKNIFKNPCIYAYMSPSDQVINSLQEKELFTWPGVKLSIKNLSGEFYLFYIYFPDISLTCKIIVSEEGKDQIPGIFQQGISLSPLEILTIIEKHHIFITDLQLA